MNDHSIVQAPVQQRQRSAFVSNTPTHPQVVRYLEERGFEVADAARYGWYEAPAERARELLAIHPSDIVGHDVALIQPRYSSTGELDRSYNRAIVFPIDELDPHRKLSPSGKKAANCAAFLPGVDYENAERIILCESLTKAATVNRLFGEAAVGLNGVDGWRPEDFVGLPDVPVVFLSDSLRRKSRHNIEGAARRLSACFGDRFSWTYPRNPPSTWPKEDWGIDDAMVNAGDAAHYEWVRILKAARPVIDSDADTIPTTSAIEILGRPAAGWVVKGLIPAAELVNIVGATNCGKTFLTMDLLLAVARGVPHWYGGRVKRSGPVVHITLEGGGLPNRLRAYQLHHKLNPVDLENYHAIEQPISLRDGAQTEAIIASIAKVGQPVLIAVDTVNRALAGGDENSSTDMGALLANAERIKAAFPASAVLLVHHMGKDEGRGARGHSSLSCNVGAELHVKNDGTGIRTVTLEKQRDGTTDQSFNFKLTVVDVGRDEDGDAITSCVVEPSEPPPDARDASDLDIYNAMRATWTAVNSGKPVTHDLLWRNSALFKPKDSKLRRDDLSRVFKLAIEKGWLKLAHGQPANGTAYVFTVVERKY